MRNKITTWSTYLDRIRQEVDLTARDHWVESLPDYKSFRASDDWDYYTVERSVSMSKLNAECTAASLRSRGLSARVVHAREA